MLEGSKKFPWGYIILGTLLMTVGICFIIFNTASTVLAVIIGITLAIFGILCGVLTLAESERGLKFVIRIIFSVMAIISGVVVAILNSAAIPIISDMFCLLLITDGAFKLQTAIQSKRVSAFGWWFMLMLSLLIIISTFITNKYSTLAEDGVLTVVLGIIIAVDGFSNLTSSFYLGRIYRKEGKSLPDNQELTVQKGN